MDLTSWEAASDLVRGWEAAGRIGEIRPEVPTLAQAVARFLEDAEARKLRSETMRKLRYDLRRFADWCEERGIRQLRRVDLDLLREFRESWKDAALTQIKRIERLRSFFRFTQAAGWIERNQAKDLKPPKVTPNPTLPFTELEFEAILEACDNYPDEYGRLGTEIARRLKGVVLVMRFAGLRVQDAVCLRKDALSHGKIQLYTAKTGVPVYVPIAQWVEEELLMIPEASRDHFFWTGRGKKTSVTGHYQRRLQRLFKLAKVKNGHSHRLRDTFAVSLLENSVPLDFVATLLGNTVKIAEKHYAPWVHSRRRALEDSVRRTWKSTS